MYRRDALKAIGGVATLSVVAGCLGGDDGETAGSDVPREWVPSPEQLASDLDHYQVFSTAPAVVTDYSDQLDSSTWDAYQREWLDWSIASPDADEVERYIRGGDTEIGVGFGLVVHDLDGQQLRESLQEMGFESDGSYEGFDILVSANGQQARGFSGRHLVVGQSQAGGRAVVESAIDTGLGNATRYVERDALTDLLSQIDTEHNYRFRTQERNDLTISVDGVFAGSVGQGYSLALDEAFSATHAERFAEDAEIPTGALEEYAQSGDLFDGAQDVEIGTGTNIGLLRWTADPAALSLNQLG